jgi:hypothetical protein
MGFYQIIGTCFDDAVGVGYVLLYFYLKLRL